MLRWITTAMLAVPMAGILYVLNIERLRRDSEYWLPDPALSFEAFQAELAAHKTGMVWQAGAWALLIAIGIAACGYLCARVHRRLAGLHLTPVRLHWLGVGYAVPLFFCSAAWMVALIHQ